MVASDRVGAARDLILPVAPDLVYPCVTSERLPQFLRSFASIARVWLTLACLLESIWRVGLPKTPWLGLSMRLRVLLVAAIVETDTIMRGLSRGGGIMMAMPNYHVLGKPYMRTFGTFPSLRVARNPLVTLFIFVFVIYLGYKAAQAILANDLSTLIYAGTFLVGGGGCIAVLNDWRRGVYPLVAWILFEDFSESV